MSTDAALLSLARSTNGTSARSTAAARFAVQDAPCRSRNVLEKQVRRGSCLLHGGARARPLIWIRAPRSRRAARGVRSGDAMIELASFVSGQWKKGGGKGAELLNPATEAILARTS